MDAKQILLALALSLSGDSQALRIETKQDSTIEWLSEQKSKNFLNYDCDKLKITDAFGKEIYSERINLPEGVTLEVLAGKYLKLSSQRVSVLIIK